MRSRHGECCPSPLHRTRWLSFASSYVLAICQLLGAKGVAEAVSGAVAAVCGGWRVRKRPGTMGSWRAQQGVRLGRRARLFLCDPPECRKPDRPLVAPGTVRPTPRIQGEIGHLDRRADLPAIGRRGEMPAAGRVPGGVLHFKDEVAGTRVAAPGQRDGNVQYAQPHEVRVGGHSGGARVAQQQRQQIVGGPQTRRPGSPSRPTVATRQRPFRFRGRRDQVLHRDVAAPRLPKAPPRCR